MNVLLGEPGTKQPGDYAFYRAEMRHSSRRRELDCNHAIDHGEPYRYAVAKIIGADGLWQSELCDVCMRHGDAY